MDEYPTEEEQFELMYGDELELLNEQEEFNPVPKRSRKSLEFPSQPSQKLDTNNKENEAINNHNFQISQDLFESDFTPLRQKQPLSSPGPSRNNTQNDKEIEVTLESLRSDNQTKKRTIEELFGDIDDLLFEHKNIQTLSKKRKGDDTDNKLEADYALIDHILQLRKLNKEKNSSLITSREDCTQYLEDRDKYNLSLTVPNYPFIGVRSHKQERVYVRFHSEDYEKEETLRIVNQSNCRGVLGNAFKEIWNQANSIINKKLNESQNLKDITMEPSRINKEVDKELWVDLYKPRKYRELLSDESTNRVLLKWIKLWDEKVFNRRPKVRIPKPVDNNKFNKFQKVELNTELDPDGRPHHKIALLCGPPGLGKTTLAHMVARHAGYNVVEINASDDRSVDVFKRTLQNATQMTSVLDEQRRPNCIVFDEIDGAPSSSIDYLVKFASGAKSNNKKEKNSFLRRPIICICNDLYVASLRPLRQIAFVVNFPQTSSLRLSERLMEIARRQGVKTDSGAMLALAEKSHNDIRSCLSILHFFKAQRKPVTLTEIHKSSVGQKDMQKGLFSVWQDIFQIDRPQVRPGSTERVPVSSKARMDKILNTVNSFGDYEKVAQGVFENFPLLTRARNPKLEDICTALDWFCHFDIQNNRMRSLQNYSLLPYLPYAFVVWHFTFASSTWQKLKYPSASYEAKVKTDQRKAIVREVIDGIQPPIRIYTQSTSLILDVLPMIAVIITPKLRAVNVHLFTKEEKAVLSHVVDVMVTYNLNYVQERTADGDYPYKLDPDIEQLVSFSKKASSRLKSLSHLSMQLIAHEVDLAKMRVLQKSDGSARIIEKKIPNHMQTLKIRPSKAPAKPVIVKDFFGRVIEMKSPPSSSSSGSGGGKSGPNHKNDIYFKYKEGHNNAVRRKIKIASLK